MKNYYKIDEISIELGVSRETIRKNIKKLGLDSRKIDETAKSLLVKELQSTLNIKNKGKMLESKVLGAKVEQSDEIPIESKSSLEILRIKAIQRYNLLEETAKNLEIVIKEDLGFVVNGTNGLVGLSPAVKGITEITKQQNALTKTIKELEEALKYNATSKVDDVISDE